MSGGTVPSVELRAMLRVVEDETGIAPDAVLGRGRTPAVVRARAAVVWTARTVIGASSPQIGLALDRDHTTILHLHARAETWRSGDLAFARLTTRLRLAVVASRRWSRPLAAHLAA